MHPRSSSEPELSFVSEVKSFLWKTFERGSVEIKVISNRYNDHSADSLSQPRGDFPVPEAYTENSLYYFIFRASSHEQCAIDRGILQNNLFSSVELAKNGRSIMM